MTERDRRDANGAGLIGDRARYGLQDPPDGVSGELVAAAVFKPFRRFHQPDVALLNQVQERNGAVEVSLGQGDDQPEIGFDHFRSSLVCFGQHAFQLDPAAEPGRSTFATG